MSPRLAVGDVSIAIEGSAPCPPGRTMSAPNDGFPPAAELPAVTPGTRITAANETSASTQPSRRNDHCARIFSSSLGTSPNDCHPASVCLTAGGESQTRLPGPTGFAIRARASNYEPTEEEPACP